MDEEIGSPLWVLRTRPHANTVTPEPCAWHELVTICAAVAAAAAPVLVAVVAAAVAAAAAVVVVVLVIVVVVVVILHRSSKLPLPLTCRVRSPRNGRQRQYLPTPCTLPHSRFQDVGVDSCRRKKGNQEHKSAGHCSRTPGGWCRLGPWATPADRPTQPPHRTRMLGTNWFSGSEPRPPHPASLPE